MILLPRSVCGGAIVGDRLSCRQGTGAEPLELDRGVTHSGRASARIGSSSREINHRVLFGTDVGTRWFAPDLGGAADKIHTRAPSYKRYFDYLETDKLLPADFVDVTKGQEGVRLGVPGKRQIQGLALPQEVLEKIYFRNAMRIYPHVKDHLKKLGCPVE